MSDFAATYDRFLDLIEDGDVRDEVRECVVKMAQSEAQSDGYVTAHRDLVRVLKSRAPQVLPTAWREDPQLENVSRTFHHGELLKDWKSVMEDEGVFFMGRIPTFEDIDKHYGSKGWKGNGFRPDARGVKMPHAPRQEPHGNESGVRHNVVRLASLPKYRNNIEQLARDLGKPDDTPYRELVQFKGDDGHRQRVQELFDDAFVGSEAEEAAEGTGKGGENFKLSAGNARGARADEHQDPVVRSTDTPARLQRARDRATERSGEDRSEASIAELLDEVGDTFGDFDTAMFTAAKRLGRFKQFGTVMRDYIRATSKNQQRVESAQRRVSESGGDGEALTEAFGEIAEAMVDQGHETAALDVLLYLRPELREQFSDEDVALIEKGAQDATAAGVMARAINYAAQHQYNARDAGDHERVAGPDTSDETHSSYVSFLPELLAGFEDVTERGSHEPRVQVGRHEREEAKPEVEAKPKPARLPVEAKPEVEAKPKPKPAKPVPTEAKPEADIKPAKGEALRELQDEMARRGLTPAGGYRDFIRDEMIENNLSAKEVVDMFEDDPSVWEKDKTPAVPTVAETKPEVEEKPAAPKRLPTSRPSRDEDRAARRAEDEAAGGRRVQQALPGFGAVKPRTEQKPSKPEVSLADALDLGAASGRVSARLETWRNKLQSKIKDETKVDSTLKGLERQLKAVKGADDTDRRLKVIDALEAFARKNGLEAEGTNYFPALRAAVNPRSKTNPDGFEKPRRAPMQPRMKKRLPLSTDRLPLNPPAN